MDEALRDYARANGRNWKAKLRLLWESGKDEGYLRQARNRIGPRGLETYQLIDA